MQGECCSVVTGRLRLPVGRKDPGAGARRFFPFTARREVGLDITSECPLPGRVRALQHPAVHPLDVCGPRAARASTSGASCSGDGELVVGAVLHEFGGEVAADGVHVGDAREVGGECGVVESGGSLVAGLVHLSDGTP